jgi:uncharacterized protein YlxW (UPF0749 family)
VDRTNAERQRRYIAKLKAAATQAQAQDTALRQKVTVLEQRLASIKREGLADKAPASVGIEALQAARTKASIGVVGVGIEE